MISTGRERSPLITDTKMTEDEVLSAVSLEPGAGDLDPILSVKKTPNGFSIFGEYYEKDEKKDLSREPHLQ